MTVSDKINGYRLLAGRKPGELAMAVDEYIKAGWRPWGSPHVVVLPTGWPQYTQAVVLR